MKRLFAFWFLILICGAVLAQQSEDTSEPLIVAGKGWGKFSLGVERKTVESVIGEGQNRSRYDDVYFIDYPTKGIQISYKNSDDTLHNVYFYNGQHRCENFATFEGKTDKATGTLAFFRMNISRSYSELLQSYSPNGRQAR